MFHSPEQELIAYFISIFYQNYLKELEKIVFKFAPSD